jgi:hypothetical protein
MSGTSSTINSIFSAHLDHPEGKEKLAAVAQAYVRDKLRENSFARKILPPMMVTKADMQVSVNHDTLVYIDEIEPNSRAMSLTFRGQPTARFISAPRYEIPCFTISSERFEKTEQELLAYRMPITKVIEDNSVKDIQEIEDVRFLTHVKSCTDATGQSVMGEQASDEYDANGYNSFEGVLQRGDLVKLFKELDSKRRRCAKILINEEDWDDILSWTIEDYGDTVQGKVVVDGYTYDRIMGRMVVRTIKTDILETGNIYGFTSPEFLGKFLILNNTKFYIDKVANLIQWQCWEDIGMGFGNVSSIAHLKLYNAEDASDVPTESEIGGGTNGVFNKAATGVTFPSVTQY